MKKINKNCTHKVLIVSKSKIKCIYISLHAFDRQDFVQEIYYNFFFLICALNKKIMKKKLRCDLNESRQFEYSDFFDENLKKKVGVYKQI